MSNGTAGPLTASAAWLPARNWYELTVIGSVLPLLMICSGGVPDVPALVMKLTAEGSTRMSIGSRHDGDHRRDVGVVTDGGALGEEEVVAGVAGERLEDGDLVEVREAVAVGVDRLDVGERLRDRLADVELLLDRLPERIARAGAGPFEVAVAARVRAGRSA